MWRVRSDKGDLFGPADIETLQAWARDGRLAPTSTVSEDNQNWVPVTSITEIEMDWLAEMGPGAFFGPIHKNAISTLIRDGSIRNTAPLFQRVLPGTQPVSDRERALETRIHDIQHQLYARIGEMEAQLASGKAEIERHQKQVSAQALDFERKGEDFQQMATALQNEIAARDKQITDLTPLTARVENLEKERSHLQQKTTALQSDVAARDKQIASLSPLMARVETLEKERQDLQQKVAATEQRAAEITRLRDESQSLVEQTRRENSQAQTRIAEAQAAQAAAGQALSTLRERMQIMTRDVEALRETSRQSRTRLDTVRKLLQQAAQAAGGIAELPTDAEVVVTPPPVTSPIATNTASSPEKLLANIEAQVQRELRQVGTARRGERTNP
jgi:DNA repair exonuclease SbcCD ATPase subunit